MTLEALTQRLQTVCGENLRSVILYGSSVTGDHAGRRSNYNVLVVLHRLGLDDLKALSPVVRAWVRGGQPAPLLWTQESLRRSADAFPLEIADLQAAHRELYGTDVLDTLPVDAARLRLQLEHELKSRLLALRQHYLLTPLN